MEDTTSSLEGFSPSRLSLARWWPQVTAFLIVVVEMCWLVPWYRMVIQVSRVASPLTATLVLGAIMLFAYGLTQILESVRLLHNVQIAIIILLFCLSLFIASQLLLAAPVFSVVNGLVSLNPGEVLVVFALMWLWWRGVSLGREPIRPLVAWRRFELGLLLFMAYVFIIARMDENLPTSPLLGLFIFFLFMGLMSVIFARISYSGLSHGVHKNPFDRRWMLSTILILGAAVGLAALLGGLLTGQYSLLFDWAAETVKLVVAAMIFIASLPGLLLSNLLGPLIPLLRRAMSAATPTPEPLGAYPAPFIPQVTQPVPISPVAQTFFFWTLIALILFLVFVRARRSGTYRRERLDESESLLEEGEARRLMRKALLEAAGNLTSRLRPRQRQQAAARVRRIYADLMDLCAELSIPRPASHTPLEFVPVMGEVFSEQGRELELITRAYNKVRYGELPETHQELSALESAWKAISEQGERLKKSGQLRLKTAEIQDVRRSGT